MRVRELAERAASHAEAAEATSRAPVDDAYASIDVAKRNGASSTPASTHADYDLLPYPSMPIPYTQPAHLAATATLFGLTPAAIDRARVLLEETLAILRRYDDRWSRAMSLTSLAHVELAAGEVARAELLLAEGAALFRTLGNLLYVPWCLEGLAGVAAARGEWERAARFCGLRDALRARIGPSLPPAHPSGYEATLTAIHAGLDEAAFTAEYAAGRTLPVDEALAEGTT